MFETSSTKIYNNYSDEINQVISVEFASGYTFTFMNFHTCDYGISVFRRTNDPCSNRQSWPSISFIDKYLL